MCMAVTHKLHAAVGWSGFMAATAAPLCPWTLTLGAGWWLGSLVPDLDHPNSLLSWTLFPLVRNRKARCYLWKRFVDPWTGGHRERTHYAPAVLAAGVALEVVVATGYGWRPGWAPAGLLSAVFVAGVTAGCVTHIATDQLTAEAFAAWTRRRTALYLFRTNSWREHLIVAPLSLLVAGLFGWVWLWRTAGAGG
jgi:hypothetical protein